MFNPFKSLGDINEMRKQAGAIQKALAALDFSAKEGNFEIRMNGNQEVQDVTIDGVPNESAKRAVNNIIKQVQQAAARQFAEMSKGMN